jgi:hypothetical protein
MRLPLVYGVLGCSLRMWRYAVCPVWPSCAIMREDPRIFFAHTLRHVLVEAVHRLFLASPEWIFFLAYVKPDFVTSTDKYWRHGCSWATMRVYFAHEKNDLTINTYTTSDRFFLFLRIPLCMHARATAEPLCVSRRVKAFTRLIHTWEFRIWLHIDQRGILGHFLLHFNLRPDSKSQGARI